MKTISRITALVAAVLLHAAQPGLLSIALSSVTLLVSHKSAKAQSLDTAPSIARAITVRIEGATQGSGVLISKQGTRYTVLTSWHVLSSNKSGEEISIITADGALHMATPDSSQQIGNIDIATIQFSSTSNYSVAQMGRPSASSMGDQLLVAGYPLPTTAVPVKMLRLISGSLVAKSDLKLPGGYQLLYSNPTLPGMSGGPVLDRDGLLIAIHGKAERDDHISERLGKSVASRTNMGIPIPSSFRRSNESVSNSRGLFLGPSSIGQIIILELDSVTSLDQFSTRFRYRLGGDLVKATANCMEDSWTTYPESVKHRPQSATTRKMMKVVCQYSTRRQVSQSPTQQAVFVFDPPSNIRSQPNGTIICRVTQPSRIIIYSGIGKWKATDYCGTKGYIHSSQFRVESL